MLFSISVITLLVQFCVVAVKPRAEKQTTWSIEQKINCLNKCNKHSLPGGITRSKNPSLTQKSHNCFHKNILSSEAIRKVRKNHENTRDNQNGSHDVKDFTNWCKNGVVRTGHDPHFFQRFLISMRQKHNNNKHDGENYKRSGFKQNHVHSTTKNEENEQKIIKKHLKLSLSLRPSSNINDKTGMFKTSHKMADLEKDGKRSTIHEAINTTILNKTENGDVNTLLEVKNASHQPERTSEQILENGVISEADVSALYLDPFNALRSAFKNLAKKALPRTLKIIGEVGDRLKLISKQKPEKLMKEAHLLYSEGKFFNDTLPRINLKISKSQNTSLVF